MQLGKEIRKFIQFLHVALGSLAELETQYLIVVRLGFTINNEEFENLTNNVKRLLIGFRNYLNKK